MNKSKLFGGRLETYVKPWGHLNKQMESFRYQNSLCDTVDVWDGGCAPIFCLLVTTRHADGRTPTDILHSTHPHRHFSKHAKKSFAISSLCSFEVALILKFHANICRSLRLHLSFKFCKLIQVVVVSHYTSRSCPVVRPGSHLAVVTCQAVIIR